MLSVVLENLSVANNQTATINNSWRARFFYAVHDLQSSVVKHMHELLYLHEQNASESTPTDHPTLKC